MTDRVCTISRYVNGTDLLGFANISPYNDWVFRKSSPKDDRKARKGQCAFKAICLGERCPPALEPVNSLQAAISGIIPYITWNNKAYLLLGIDHQGLLTDFAGGVSTGEKPLACAFRNLNSVFGTLLNHDSVIAPTATLAIDDGGELAVDILVLYSEFTAGLVGKYRKQHTDQDIADLIVISREMIPEYTCSPRVQKLLSYLPKEM